MNIHTIWQCATTSRRTREREAAAAAQYERVHREGALRDDFARRTHELEAQIAQAHAENCRLRAENRALLNSVLGIAGIPPVIVNDPPASAGNPGADAWRDAARKPAVSRDDARHDVAHLATLPIPESRHSEERSDEEPLFVSPKCFGAKPKRDPSGESGPQDDSPIGGEVAANGSGSPSTFAEHTSAMPVPSQTPVASTALGTNAVTPQKQMRRARTAPRPRNDAHSVAPIRRRSWHQIYRMLEFESSRRKDQDS